MTQYKNIPQPQSQRNIQPDLLGNFQYLCTPLGTTLNRNGVISVDHAASGDNEANPEDGFHSQLSFSNQPQQLAPLPANAVNGQTANSALFPYFDASSASQIAFITSAINAQLTGKINPDNAANGSSFLPSAVGSDTIMVQWGSTDLVLGVKTVNFSPVFSAAPYSIIIMPFNNTLVIPPDLFIVDGSVNANSFDIRVFTLTIAYVYKGCYWFAIGPK